MQNELFWGRFIKLSIAKFPLGGNSGFNHIAFSNGRGCVRHFTLFSELVLKGLKYSFKPPTLVNKWQN